MREIISNTTPIIALLKIGQLQLLKEIYQTIIVPQAVFEEIEKGKSKGYYVDLSKLDWIEIKEVKENNTASLNPGLDAGEAQVIALAGEIHPDLVIIDEAAGRKVAKEAGLKVTGTLGILMKAKEKGLIDAISPLLQELQENGIWLSNRLKEIILTKVNE